MAMHKRSRVGKRALLGRAEQEPGCQRLRLEEAPMEQQDFLLASRLAGNPAIERNEAPPSAWRRHHKPEQPRQQQQQQRRRQEATNMPNVKSSPQQSSDPPQAQPATTRHRRRRNQGRQLAATHPAHRQRSWPAMPLALLLVSLLAALLAGPAAQWQTGAGADAPEVEPSNWFNLQGEFDNLFSLNPTHSFIHLTFSLI